MKKLKKKLLSLGGEAFQHDWFLKESFTQNAMNIMAECGIAIIRPKIKMMRGDCNRCHHNARKLSKDKGYDCMTGFGLSEDGVWRVHAWCLNGKVVIEATTPRVIYYGLPTEGFSVKETS